MADKETASTNRTDQPHVDLEEIQNAQPNKLDKRFQVDYTFKGTGVENVPHKFGRTPSGYMISSIDKQAQITGHAENFDAKHAKLQCSVAGTKVRLLFY